MCCQNVSWYNKHHFSPYVSVARLLPRTCMFGQLHKRYHRHPHLHPFIIATPSSFIIVITHSEWFGGWGSDGKRLRKNYVVMDRQSMMLRRQWVSTLIFAHCPHHYHLISSSSATASPRCHFGSRWRFPKPFHPPISSLRNCGLDFVGHAQGPSPARR